MCGLERWRDVVGYEGLYQVSDLGRVRSIDRVVTRARNGRVEQAKLKGKILRAWRRARLEHVSVDLCKNGVRQSILVHRLVVAAWIGPCPAGQEVRHGPNGVADNSVSNLSYGTRSQNLYDKRRDGTDNGRSVIRSDGAIFTSMAIAAEETGCTPQNICNCCAGRRKTAGKYGWSYYDD